MQLQKVGMDSGTTKIEFSPSWVFGLSWNLVDTDNSQWSTHDVTSVNGIIIDNILAALVAKNIYIRVSVPIPVPKPKPNERCRPSEQNIVTKVFGSVYGLKATAVSFGQARRNMTVLVGNHFGWQPNSKRRIRGRSHRILSVRLVMGCAYTISKT